MTVADIAGISRIATGRNVASLLLRSAYRLRVSGTHLVPSDGGVILAANHLGLVDGPVLFAASPRPLHLLAKSELFVGPLGPLFRSMGQVPIDYETPDRSALRDAVAHLANGDAVGMFPEAHRGRGDVSRMRHGIAYLALRSGAPIVPVAILGTRETGAGRDAIPTPRSTIHVVFGEPVRFPADPGDHRRATIASAGELLRQRLADHVSQAIARTGEALPSDDVTRGKTLESPAAPRSHRRARS